MSKHSVVAVLCLMFVAAGLSTIVARPEAPKAAPVTVNALGPAQHVERPSGPLQDEADATILADTINHAEVMPRLAEIDAQEARTARRARVATRNVQRAGRSARRRTAVAGVVVERAEPSGDVWGRLAQCESGMRNDGGAPYYGYFQFSAATWHSIGMSGLPNDYDYGTQLEAAQRLQARSGFGQWPVCSRKAGAR